MLILFSGKGGSGKTTTAALVADHAAGHGRTVVALDTDTNQRLARRFEGGRQPAALTEVMADFMATLYAHNAHVTDPDTAHKSVPPTQGSPLFSGIAPSRNPLVAAAHVAQNSGVISMRTGEMSAQDQLNHCNHFLIGAALRLGLHTVTLPGELLIADTMAGNDNATGGLPSIADGAFIVVEPEFDSFESYRQVAATYAELGVPNIAVVANKVEDRDDLEFIARHIGVMPDYTFPREKNYFRAVAEGERPALPNGLTSAVAGLHEVIAAWQPEPPTEKYLRAVKFHNLNNPDRPIPAELAQAHSASYTSRVEQLRAAPTQLDRTPPSTARRAGPRTHLTGASHVEQPVAATRSGNSPAQ